MKGMKEIGKYRREVREVIKKELLGGFPGGSVVKSPPANAGDMGSIPGEERLHMLQSN